MFQVVNKDVDANRSLHRAKLFACKTWALILDAQLGMRMKKCLQLFQLQMTNMHVTIDSSMAVREKRSTYFNEQFQKVTLPPFKEPSQTPSTVRTFFELFTLSILSIYFYLILFRSLFFSFLYYLPSRYILICRFYCEY